MASHELHLLDLHAVERVARIMGEGSAAQRALHERARRIANGEDVHIFQHTAQPLFVVGPLPEGQP